MRVHGVMTMCNAVLKHLLGERPIPIFVPALPAQEEPTLLTRYQLSPSPAPV
jgi:hypothetical protein